MMDRKVLVLINFTFDGQVMCSVGLAWIVDNQAVYHKRQVLVMCSSPFVNVSRSREGLMHLTSYKIGIILKG